MGDTLFELGFIVFLALLNGVFVAAEIALVSLRPSRVEQMLDEGRRGAGRVRRLTSDPGRFLAVIQLAITFIGFLASAFAGVSLAASLTELFEGIGMDPDYAGGVALLLVTILLSLFTIVFGELVPKTLALAHPEPSPSASRARWTSSDASSGRSSRCSRRPRGASPGCSVPEVNTEAQITAEELRLIVERGGEQGILEAEEEQMINAVIELGDRRIHEVMVPRIAIVSLPASSTFDEAIDRIIEEGHSRVPVFESSVDEIVGILYAKDLLPFLKSTVDEGPRPADACCGRPSSCRSR